MGRTSVKGYRGVENMINKVAGSVGEPNYVTAYNRATFAHDAKITDIRKVFETAPETRAPVARAWIDAALDTATASGDFGSVQKLWNRWENLGVTRQSLLFPDAGVRKGLNDFFLYAKESGKTLNPSGTGQVVSMSGQIAYIFNNPSRGIAIQIPGKYLSDALHNPATVRLLVRGMKAKPSHSGVITPITKFLRKIPGAKILRGEEAFSRWISPLERKDEETTAAEPTY